jgi:acetyl esterase/lipase
VFQQTGGHVGLLRLEVSPAGPADEPGRSAASQVVGQGKVAFLMTREPTLFDAELAAVLPALAGFVPVKTSLDQLGHFRSLSSPNRDNLIGDLPVDCVDHRIPGYQGDTIVVSVISRKDHQRPGPGICFLHGGGMVMGNRFAGAAPVVQWAMRHDAVCVAVEYRLAPEHPSPVPVEDCYAGLVWMAAQSQSLAFDPNRLVIFGGSGGGGLAAGRGPSPRWIGQAQRFCGPPPRSRDDSPS